MASGEKIFSTSTYIECRLAWTETEISVPNNTSRVWASMSYRRTNSYGGTTYEEGYGFHVIIGGQWYKVGDSVSIPPYDNSWHEIGSASRVMTHNADGSLTIGIGCYHDGVLGLFDCNESTTAVLDTIPRASLPSVSPNPITLSATTNVLTVATNRKSSSFTHSVTCAIGSYSSTQTGVTESTTFDIPKTVISDFTVTSKTLDGTITCVTYNGSTQIGTKEVTFTAQVDETQEHPSITSVTLTDTNPNSAAIEASGSYIKYATNLSASIVLGVTGSYTELASAVVQCGTKQQTYALSGTSQTITFTYDKLDADALIVTVYDKRGTTATQTKTWTLIPYRDITATGSVDRMSETGNTISFSLSGACFGGSFGAVANSVTVTYKYKLHNASAWTDGSETFTFTPSGSGETTYTYSNTLTGFAYDQQFDFQFTVTDMFTDATTRVLVLTVGIPVYGNGEDFFSVYGKSYLHFDRDNPNKFWNLKEGLDAILEYHAQTNLLTITAVTATDNGITFTVNEDGTVKAVGEATGDASITLGSFTGDSQNYILSGCPSGGSASTYSIAVGNDSDYGSGVTFTGGTSHSVLITIKSGQNIDLTFMPMIRDARIASDVFVKPVKPFKLVEYSDTTVSPNGRWSVNTYISGYTSVMYALRYANSGTTDCAVEGWNNKNTSSEAIAGYCSRNGHVINVFVLYVKEGLI